MVHSLHMFGNELFYFDLILKIITTYIKQLISHHQIINELYFFMFCWQVSASKSEMIMGKLSTIKVVRRSVTKVNDSKTFLLSNLRRKFLTA